MNLPMPLFEVQTNLGEVPVWSAAKNELYWVDINAGMGWLNLLKL